MEGFTALLTEIVTSDLDVVFAGELLATETGIAAPVAVTADDDSIPLFFW